MNEELAAELLAMVAVDQEIAARCLAASQADERLRGLVIIETPRNLWPPVYEEAVAKNAIHASRLLEIVGDHGWPGLSLVGTDAAEALWLLATHAPASAIQEVLPHLAESVSVADADAEHLAILSDRLAMYEQRPQPYGTHLRMAPGGGRVAIGPPADERQRDADRAAIGLDSWDGYVARLLRGSEEEQRLDG